MRLCSLLSQPCQGDHVLFFWVCPLPNISSRVSRRTSSRSMSIRPTTSPPNSTITESPVDKTERKPRQGLCLREHLPIGRLVHAEMLTSAHAARWISQARWGASATPASATGGGTFLTRLLGGPSLNSNPSSHGWCWSCGPAGRASTSHKQEGEGEHIINETNAPTDTASYTWASVPTCTA